MIDEQALLNFIINIISNNQNKIDELYKSKGGFEGWFQCELYYALISSNQYNPVEREYPITHLRSAYADLYVGGLYVELKVDSIYRTNIDDEFLRDIDRMGQYGYAVLISKKTYSNTIDKNYKVSTVNGYNIFIV